MKRIGNGNQLPGEPKSVAQQIAELRKAPEAQYRGELKSVNREPEPTPGTQQWMVWVEEGVRMGTMTKLQADAAKASWAVPATYKERPSAMIDVSYQSVREAPSAAPLPPREPIDIFAGTEGIVNVPMVLLAVLVTIMAFPWVGAFLNFLMRGGQPWVPGMN